LPAVTPVRKRIITIAIVAAIAAAIAFDVWGPSIDKDANRFASALLNKDWQTAYRFASRDEISGWQMTEPQFAAFCEALADHCWPEDVTPLVVESERLETVVRSGEVGIGLQNSPNGSRRYAVTVYRKRDHVSVQVFYLQFRHGWDGEWHPDVLDALLQLDRGNYVRGGQPPQNVLAALQAVGAQKLTVYPDQAILSQSQIHLFLDHKAKYWTSDPEPN